MQYGFNVQTILDYVRLSYGRVWVLPTAAVKNKHPLNDSISPLYTL